MKKAERFLLSVVVVTVSVIAGLLLFFWLFLQALAPPAVKLTQAYISTGANFCNGLTIEKIQVDSIGANKHPLKYSVTHWAECRMSLQAIEDSDCPDIIYFDQMGDYYWQEYYIRYPVLHTGLRRSVPDSLDIWKEKAAGQVHRTCPVYFKPEQWYFINIHDPQVTGIYLYIDKDGERHTYKTYSGVSPI